MLLTAAALFTCTPVAVWDGDGPIWCREGQHIRIHGIAARELDGTCFPSHPCPRSSGVAARNALVKLLGGPRGERRSGHIRVKFQPLQCQSFGTSHHRVVADCTLPDGRKLSAAMMKTGTVKRWKYRQR